MFIAQHNSTPTTAENQNFSKFCLFFIKRKLNLFFLRTYWKKTNSFVKTMLFRKQGNFI